MNTHWYALRSKPHKEFALWRELSARGFDSFYPQLCVRPVNMRSRMIRPYFPGYLFLHTDIEQVGVGKFQWMPFSCGLVSFDGVPGTIPNHLIEAIRSHLDRINAQRHMEQAGLKQGDVVVIQGGPFDGYEAIFDARVAGRERARVLVKLLQVCQVNLELPETQVQIKTQR